MADSIQLEKLSADEAGALSAISRETFFAAFYHLNNADDMEAYAANAFNIDTLKDEINTPGSVFYFARFDREVVGFIKLNTGNAQHEFKRENSLEVERLYVLAKYQGRQIGQQLLRFALEQAHALSCRFIWLGVWEHNVNAIRLYERLGFEHCGSHSFMLGNDQQTDLLMRKVLR
ncbi:GNAT family N-acetyltransferase [Mucilaginibacter sp. PAMB04168]|uniref:GNAT family N-acetyltransferase n=1 Tax=Mucilaginibacter sp. PAMB04168 TaxID=3138567 RepID=UPI0031F67FBA